MILATFIRFAILIALILPRPASAEEISITGTIPSDVHEIDVTYSESGPPSVSFRSSPPAHSMPQPFRPTTSAFDLLKSLKTGKTQSTCDASIVKQSAHWIVTIQATLKTCRTVVQFENPAALDLMSYGMLSIKGTTAKPVTLALLDTFGQEVSLVRLSDPFDQRIKLTPLMRGLDPTHVAAIVIEEESGDTTFTIERFMLEQTPRPSAVSPRKGFWVWDYRSAITNPETVIEQCRRAGATRLLVQMPHGEETPDVWSGYAQLLQRIASADLEAFALDGYPEAIYNPVPLIEKVRRLRGLLLDANRYGLQLDIEPYLLARFSDPQDYDLYLQAIERIRKALDDHVRLSIVMPFWFIAKSVRNRPLAFEVMNRADEVAVMSYRTDVEELFAIAEPVLRYGEAVERPVWLAVETRPLPVDRQVTLARERRPDMANAYLDRAGRRLIFAPMPPDQVEGFRVTHRVTIRPERLTFARENHTVLQSALGAILAFPYQSLAGVLIHDLPGYLSLPE